MKLPPYGWVIFLLHKLSSFISTIQHTNKLCEIKKGLLLTMDIVFGAIVAEGRGKLGELVASRNPAGAYFRARVIPLNPASAEQVASRLRLTTLSQAWRNLTEAERSTWRIAVNNFPSPDIFGNLKTPSAFNLFQGLNNNLVTIGQPTINIAPSPQGVLTVEIGALFIRRAGINNKTISMSSPVPADTSMEIWATPDLSTNINFVKSEYRLIQIAAAASTSPVVFGQAYNMRFGLPTVGQKVFCKIKFINTITGQSSPIQQASTIVLAP